MLKIKDVKFIRSIYEKPKNYSDIFFPTFAFIGRSNVGKSSLINAILGRKKIAYVSATPGKTRSINLFLINDRFYLADLPGYGFAKLPVQVREKWNKLILSFLKECSCIKKIFHLIDIRIPSQKMDIMMSEFFKYNNLPVIYVFTKTDCLSHNKLQKQLKLLKESLNIENSQIILSSIYEKKGIEEIKKIIYNSIYKKNK